MMKKTTLSLPSLIATLILLVSGNALLTTLLSLRLSLDDVNATLIGWILVFYSIGFVLGTLYAGSIIQRVGHNRAFSVFAAILATAILLHPLAVDAALWSVLRALSGFVAAGLIIVIESWFSAKADVRNRATLFAVYQVLFFLSTAGGQILIRVSDPAGFIPFTLAAILVILAVVPLSMTHKESPGRVSPRIESGHRMPLLQLYRTSPVGTLGALIAGLLISSFYTMGPVFADRIGLEIHEIATFMAAAIIAAMILAWPLGRLCDHFNRYRILLVATGVACISSLAVALLGGFNMNLLILFAGLYIGITAALYPIAVAITNDLMDDHPFTAASTALLLSYGIGTCMGPLISAAFMEVLGPRGLFFSNALFLGILGLFLTTQPQQKKPPVPVNEQKHFYTTTPEASLGLQTLDPRNPDFGNGHSEHPEEPPVGQP